MQHCRKPRDAVRCPKTMLSGLSTRPVPLNFTNELTPIPTTDSPTAAAASIDEPEDKVHAGNEGAGADTLVWEFEAGKQLAVVTLRVSLSAIREMGKECGASVLLQTCEREASTPLVNVKAEKRRKRKRD